MAIPTTSIAEVPFPITRTEHFCFKNTSVNKYGEQKYQGVSLCFNEHLLDGWRGRPSVGPSLAGCALWGALSCGCSGGLVEVL